MHFTKQQNNVQAFVNLHIRRIILFRRQHFLQEVFARFYFLGKITTEKTVILEVIRGFIFYSSILLQLSDHMLFIIEKILPKGADVPGGTCRTILADWMNTRDFLADWPGRRDKAFKLGVCRLKLDVWYANYNGNGLLFHVTQPTRRSHWKTLDLVLYLNHFSFSNPDITLTRNTYLNIKL